MKSHFHSVIASVKEEKHDTQHYYPVRSLISTHFSGLDGLRTSQAGMWTSKRRLDTL